jgi:hypothetical protein
MNRTVPWLCLALALNGCTSGSQQVRPHPAPACAAAEPGSELLLERGALVLLGEMHGSAEAPAFVGRLACHAASRGFQLRVGLELPRTEQGRIDAFLDSDGGASARAALLAGDFWRREFQDGRSSEAMVGLLTKLTGLRRSGVHLAVFAFDEPESRDRDRQMAVNLGAAIKQHPGDLTLVLTGNLHSRVTRGRPGSPGFVPMGWYLAQEHARVIAVNSSYGGGTIWACFGPQVSDCKVYPMEGVDRGSAAFVKLEPTDGHHGVVHLGTLTASPPAVRAIGWGG